MRKNFLLFAIVVMAVFVVGYMLQIEQPEPRTTTPTPASQRIQPVPATGVMSIRTTPSGVEIEVTSDKEFPVRNELAVLRIGAQEFSLSRYPENGDFHTLIFTLTLDEYAKTSTGDLVTVQYGRDDQPSEQWNFGLLNKSSQ